jgi:hypothetical protein
MLGLFPYITLLQPLAMVCLKKKELEKYFGDGLDGIQQPFFFLSLL